MLQANDLNEVRQSSSINDVSFMYVSKHPTDQLTIKFPMRNLPVKADMERSLRCVKIEDTDGGLVIRAEFLISKTGTYEFTNRPWVECTFRDYDFGIKFYYAVITTSRYQAVSRHDSISREAMELSDSYQLVADYKLRKAPSFSTIICLSWWLIVFSLNGKL